MKKIFLHFQIFSSWKKDFLYRRVCRIFVPDFIPFFSPEKIDEKIPSSVQSEGHGSEA